MTYTIEQLKQVQASGELYRELIDEVESLTRQLRAQEITGTNIRLRTIRECAELMDLHNASGSGGLAIREKFGVPA